MPHGHRLHLGSNEYTNLAQQVKLVGVAKPEVREDLRTALAAALWSRGVTTREELDSQIDAAIRGPYDGSDAARAALITHLLQDRFCGVADPGPQTSMQVLRYGATRAPWDDKTLTWRIDVTGASVSSEDAAPVVKSILSRAFALWEKALPAHFTFNEARADADAHVDIDFKLDLSGRPWGTGLGPAEPNGTTPQHGTISLKAVPPNGNPWADTVLGLVIAHEIGHVLGLQHSNIATSLMYPYAIPAGWAFSPVDGESAQVLSDMYGWRGHAFADGRSSAYAPAIASTTPPGGMFGTQTRPGPPTVHMVWTGERGHAHLSYSTSRDAGKTWSDGQQMTWPSGGTPVHGTALTAYRSSADDPASDQLFLAWAGEREQLWYAPKFSNPGDYHAVRLEGHTSDRRPALLGAGEDVHMAWKSNGDQRVWWTTYRRGSWSSVVAIPHLITEHAPALALHENRPKIVVCNPNNGVLVECDLLADGTWTQPRPVTTMNYEAGPNNSVSAGGSPIESTISTHEPAAVTLPSGGTMLAFRRRNGRLATLRKDDSGGGAVSMWKFFTDRAPATFAAGEHIGVVWVGLDQRLSYALRFTFDMDMALRKFRAGQIGVVVELLRDL